MHTIHFYHIPSPLIPLIPSRSTPATGSQLCTLFDLFCHDPPSPAFGAHIFKSMRPPTGVQRTYQGLHPYKNWLSFPQKSLSVNSSARYRCSNNFLLKWSTVYPSDVGAHAAAYWNVDWLALVQVLCANHGGWDAFMSAEILPCLEDPGYFSLPWPLGLTVFLPLLHGLWAWLVWHRCPICVWAQNT